MFNKSGLSAFSFLYSMRVALSFVLFLSYAAITAAVRSSKQPNVLFFLVDDLGYGDLDICPSNVPFSTCPIRAATPGRAQYLKTPWLKKMASEGMIFTNFYAPQPICTPSRMGVMTGRDPIHFQSSDFNSRVFIGSGQRGGIPHSEVTMGEHMKKLGYTTGYVGKWHMGMVGGGGTNGDPVASDTYAPWKMGFDTVPFLVEGSNGEPCSSPQQKLGRNIPGDNNIYRMCTYSHISNDQNVVLEQPIRWENMTARSLSYLINLINAHANDTKPWFFQHSFTSVHSPYFANRMFSSTQGERIFTDMVGEVDWAVGTTLQLLKKLKLDENTLVIVTSDNGPYLEYSSTWCPLNCRLAKISPSNPVCEPCTRDKVSHGGPLRGGKGQTWEGGNRVPAIFWMPKTVPANTINHVVASSLDLIPTMVNMAGGNLDPTIFMDGADLTSQLTNRPVSLANTEPRTFAYWCGSRMMAVRVGRYKIVYRSQLWWNGTFQPTPTEQCAESGQCCVGSPTRLCSCELATIHNPPVVLDLHTNIAEDFTRALTPTDPKTKMVIAMAYAFKKKRMTEIYLDNMKYVNLYQVPNGVEAFPVEQYTADQLNDILMSHSNRMQVDYSVPGLSKNINITRLSGVAGSYLFGVPTLDAIPVLGDLPSPLVTPSFQQTYEFGEYRAPSSNFSLSLQMCGQQEGYLGPWEYMSPNGSLCGASRLPFGFPAQLLQSVCDWQVAAGVDSTNCRPSICPGTASNLNCNTIDGYGPAWNGAPEQGGLINLLPPLKYTGPATTTTAAPTNVNLPG